VLSFFFATLTRLPRYVLPGPPHHIIQRGNNLRVIFAADADYHFFRDAMVEEAINHRLAAAGWK
jgi:putative transposase